jgi:hypothetical protein
LFPQPSFHSNPPSMSSKRRRPSTSRCLALASAVCLAPVLAGCNPRADANVAQALNDAANEIGGVKSDIAQLESEIDSLRVVIAKQDTTIQHIAAVYNIPIIR